MTLSVDTLAPAVLELRVSGKLEKEAYRRWVPVLEAQINTHGKVNLLVYLEDFAGWSAAALWEDLKFDIRHYSDISRLALVGDDPDKSWLATLARPFTAAEVEWFAAGRLEAARAWVKSQPAQ
ncbi:MAG: STAS/SEC14 domain-containing protein [Halioglobus sp.]|nr:STAS/SEC14 domain-containing protein [Halioglobus sp.]